MALVKFIACNAAAYAGGPKDNDTLYFVSDEQRLYKGAVAYSGGIFEAVSEFPELGNRNTLYIKTSTGEVKYWNGTAYTQVVKPFATAVASADNGSLPTSKAVADYVAAEIAKIDAGTLAADIAVLKKGKADKATTLAGYGISDAYTKAQTDSAISTAIANAPHLKRIIVEQLPEATVADANTIYMVGTGAGSETSVYKEYMLINGKFELLGDSRVDLTDYATKTYADTAATNAKNAAIAAAGTAADGKIAAAIGDLNVADTAVSGQYVSSVSETDGKITVTRADLPAAATLVEGTANGTVKFNGTDVKVHGLGTAAFAATTAFDAAGAANTAKTDAIAAAKTYADGLASNYATSDQGTKADQVFAALTWGTL